MRLHVRVAGLAQELAERLGVVAAVVADEAVGRRVAALVERDAHEERAVRPQPLAPGAQRGRVVLDVLEHLEGAHRVEDGVLRERGDVAADHLPGAQSAEHLLRRLAGELVGLDPDVAVPGRQPGAERAAPRADLEDGLDPVEPGERALDQVVAKPGVEGEGGGASTPEL